MTTENVPPDRYRTHIDSFFDPRWPQQLRIGWCMGGVFAAVLAVWSLGDALVNVGHEESIFTIGSVVFGTSMLLMSVAAFRHGGIRNVLHSKRVRSNKHSELGIGIVVPGGLTLPSLAVAMLIFNGLTGLAISALNVYITDRSELPHGYDPRTTAIFALVGGIVLLLMAAAFIWFRLPTTLGLYPHGIERVVRSRKLRRNNATVQFVHWNDIEGIAGTDIVTRSGYGDVRTPMIHIHTTGRIPPEARIPHDEEHILAIVCTWLIAEPNTLLALARRMHERPHDRTLLAREDAAELLRPPPLRGRFRMARHQEASR
ncbi:hypothetical protein [Rhodococcus pyridinivorans]